MNGIIGALKEVDAETKRILIEVVKSLFEIARENKRKQASGKTEAVLKRIAVPRQKEPGASKQEPGAPKKEHRKEAKGQEGRICSGEALGNAQG